MREIFKSEDMNSEDKIKEKAKKLAKDFDENSEKIEMKFEQRK